VPFRADAVAETVMQFLGEHDKWEAAQIAVVEGHVTLEWEGQVYELPTPVVRSQGPAQLGVERT
jgi:hypothetical protein